MLCSCNLFILEPDISQVANVYLTGCGRYVFLQSSHYSTQTANITWRMLCMWFQNFFLKFRLLDSRTANEDYKFYQVNLIKHSQEAFRRIHLWRHKIHAVLPLCIFSTTTTTRTIQQFTPDQYNSSFKVFIAAITISLEKRKTHKYTWQYFVTFGKCFEVATAVDEAQCIVPDLWPGARTRKN